MCFRFNVITVQAGMHVKMVLSIRSSIHNHSAETDQDLLCRIVVEGLLVWLMKAVRCLG